MNPGRFDRRRTRADAQRYDRPRPRVASCLGAGGAYGIAFVLGVVDGLAEAGLDVRNGPMVGTSAGGYAAAALAGGVNFDDVLQAWPKEFTLKVSRAFDVTSPLYGDRRGEGVACVAIRLPTLRRTLLWGDEYHFADFVAASSSPPPFAWPHKLNARRYIDAGYASTASVDLAPIADLLVLVTPFWDGAGRAGRRAARRGRKEMRAYESCGGGRILQIGPNEEISALKAFRMRAIFSSDMARSVYPLARELGLGVGKDFIGGLT